MELSGSSGFIFTHFPKPDAQLVVAGHDTVLSPGVTAAMFLLLPLALDGLQMREIDLDLSSQFNAELVETATGAVLWS